MSNVPFAVTTPSGGVAVGSGVTKTVLQVAAPTNQCVKVNHFSCYLKGVTPTDPPCQVRVIRQTKSTGTSGGTAGVNPTSVNPQAVQSTGTYGYTAEPTNAGVVLFEDFIHPQLGGGISIPISQEWIIAGGGALGIEVTVSAGNANTANATFLCEE